MGSTSVPLRRATPATKCLGLPLKSIADPDAWKLFTEPAQSSGPENTGPERLLSGLLARGPVLSPSRITLENNGKIRSQPDRENAFVGASGGGGGIRTHGRLPSTSVFKTGALNHSATPPSPARIDRTHQGGKRILRSTAAKRGRLRFGVITNASALIRLAGLSRAG